MFKNHLNLFLVLISSVLLVKVLSVADFFSASRYQPDFDNYYLLVCGIQNGISPYPWIGNQSAELPLVFLYYYPFSLFSLHQAQTLNMIINLSAGYLCCAVLAIRFFKNHKLPLFLILSIVYYTAFLSRFSLQIGQPDLLISLFVALAISTVRFRSVILTALFALKSFFVLPLFAFVRRPKTFLSLSVCFFTVFLVSLFAVRSGRDIGHILPMPTSNFLYRENFSDNLHYQDQSLSALLSRLALAEHLPVVYMFLIATTVLIVSFTGNLELGLLFSFMVSPVLRQHYFVAIFPIIIKTFAGAKTAWGLMPAALSLFFWFPDLRLWTEPIGFPLNLIASHFFLSLVLIALAQIPQLRYNAKH